MHECFTYELSNPCKHFIRLISLSSVHLKCSCEVATFIQVGENVDYMEN